MLGWLRPPWGPFFQPGQAVPPPLRSLFLLGVPGTEWRGWMWEAGREPLNWLTLAWLGPLLPLEMGN